MFFHIESAARKGDSGMLDDLNIDSARAGALYLQIVEGISSLIEEGRLLPGSRLPSIRAFARTFGVSKTTVEMSYQILAAEGFLESVSKRGYFVADTAPGVRGIRPSSPALPERPRAPLYDFGTYFIDPDYFDAPNWKRHMNYVLRDEGSLTRYGEAQGEPELRLAVSQYLREYRGVYAQPEEIVIGAGFQSLLQLLLPMLEGAGRVVLFPEAGFPSAEVVFLQGGYAISRYGTLKEARGTGCLQYLRPGDFGLSSHKERLAFLEEVERRRVLLLEDDYNGEFRWGRRPVPALRSLDRFDNIVYFGAFSGILAPSIRISYMIVPKHLREPLARQLGTYTQTSSTVEQLALAKFMDHGFLAKQVRKMRKGYVRKREFLLEALHEEFPGGFEVRDTLSTVELRVCFPVPDSGLHARALEAGVRLKETGNPGEFLFIFAGLAEALIRPGIQALARAWGSQRS